MLVLGILGLTSHVWAQSGRTPEESVRRPANVAAETDIAITEPTGERKACTVRTIPFAGGDGEHVVRIDIHSTIDLGLAPFVERMVKEAEDGGAALILLHMDTPGGRVDEAQTIKDALIRSKVPTATFIDTHALSAGALIAYATDFIIVTEGSTMGAATPINVGAKGAAQAVGEKFVSAVRAIFRATAEAKDRDGKIAEAMVDKDVFIFDLIEKGKLLTMAGGELRDWCVADLTASDVPGVLSALNLKGARVDHRKLNWAERIARVLTDPMISGMLMTFGFLGIMLELYTPGFGVSGMIGLTCLSLFFLGHLVVNLVGLEEVLLFAAGVALIATEIFVLPGFGLAGVAGVLALGASVVLALVGSDLTFSWEIGVLPGALTRVGIALTATVVLFAIAAWYLPYTTLFRRLVLETAIDSTAFDAAAVQAPKSDPLEGQTGVALTPVRGSGKARFGDRTLDVIAEGRVIDKGERVVVVEARKGRVLVAPEELG